MRRTRPLHTVLAVVTAVATAFVIAPPVEATGSRTHPLVVDGAVDAPRSYTAADLAALPQVTLPDRRSGRAGRTATGVALDGLVLAAQPRLPDAKNASLRVSVTVFGRGHRPVSVALGELDAAFGNHPALLVPTHQRRGRAATSLVVPGDRGYARTVPQVTRVEVAVAEPDVPADVAPGDVRVSTERRSVTLTARRLGRLPATTRQVSFLASGAQQQHVETGPRLAAVLRAARVRTTSCTTVDAVAADGYVATVTPAEATSGRRPLLLSLVEDGTALARPRLVVDGDLRGGRYVTDVVQLVVTNAC